jgi:LuxR family transcriptional regulator, quorum-sensing system regulator CinR
MGDAIATASKDRLSTAFSIIDLAPEMDAAIIEIRDFLKVDHVVYHSSKMGASPSADPYIRLTYPDSWVKRYLQMGYIDIDPVIREGFLRTLPFEWSELKVQHEAEVLFMMDALAHGVGPHGVSIPVRSRQGHRALFSVSSSGTREEWVRYLEQTQPLLIEVANRLHRRAMTQIFAEDRPHLSERELDCLRWTASGKSAKEVAAILSISPYTATEYLKSCRFKLDAATSAQAVSRAVKLGLLKI